MSRKFKFTYNLTGITDTLDEDYCNVFLLFLAQFLEWEMFLDKSCRENQNTHFVISNVFSKIVPFMR